MSTYKITNTGGLRRRTKYGLSAGRKIRLGEVVIGPGKWILLDEYKVKEMMKTLKEMQSLGLITIYPPLPKSEIQEKKQEPVQPKESVTEPVSVPEPAEDSPKISVPETQEEEKNDQPKTEDNSPKKKSRRGRKAKKAKKD